ncbi:MAG: hypothetical protein BGO11_16715 [Solirubrobacterales bacterium 70-9]|nr:MAG: hypothetical protein BGO11_16715 [Solirubrobacterales bacterium 70-9]
MISYPDDEATENEAERHGIPEPVLIRDLVRIVEVLNLAGKEFFGGERVLAGSMALRCFHSPRFTVYDADFATSTEAQPARGEMLGMLSYADDDLEITPAELTPHDARGSAWKSEPISYLPAFTALAPEDSRSFKADISSRGLVLPGIETGLEVPYDLGIWSEAPVVWIMDPHEIGAEKILGWVLHREAKHYADLAFIALAAQPAAGPLLEIVPARLRETLAAKLEIMRGVQPTNYAPWSSVEDVARTLAEDPVFGSSDWGKLVYLRSRRDMFSQAMLKSAVQNLLVPMLR